jgi:hypothetical protein
MPTDVRKRIDATVAVASFLVGQRGKSHGIRYNLIQARDEHYHLVRCNNDAGLLHVMVCHALQWYIMLFRSSPII